MVAELHSGDTTDRAGVILNSGVGEKQRLPFFVVIAFSFQLNS